MNIIEAFDRHFIFYYLSEADSQVVIFMIFLLGRKSEAENYLIEFGLKQNYRILKYLEHCYSDADHLWGLIDKHVGCFAISKNVIESYLLDGHINFQFIIKPKNEVEQKMKKTGDSILTPPVDRKQPPKSTAPPVVPVLPFKEKSKGILNANVRKASLSVVPAGGGVSPLPVRKEEPTVVPLVSSINKADGQTTTKPSSINKDDRSTDCCRSYSLTNDGSRKSQTIKTSAEPGRAGNHRSQPIQPYKNCDEKMFRYKYPPTSLTKPAYKK